MRRIPALALTLVLASAVLVACGGSGGDTSGTTVTADGMMAPAAEPALVPEGTAAQKSAVEQQVITTMQVGLQVEDVVAANQAVSSLVSSNQGVIANSDMTTAGDARYATVTARIPADRLDAFVAQVSDLGTVQSVSRQAADVTAQVVDIDARIAALQSSVDRLKELLSQTAKVADLVAVETELTARQAELDSLRAQQRYLADQVAMSTVTISISPIVAGSTTTPGFVGGLRNGWAAFVTLVSTLITAAGFLLPFVAVGLVIPLVVWLIWRARHRKGVADS